jgi:hypothetical protein
MDQESSEERWAHALSRRVVLGENLEFSAAQLARQLEETDVSRLEAFLSKLVEWGSAIRFTVFVCPMSTCRQPIPLGVDPTACPSCRTNFVEEGVDAIAEPFFRLIAAFSRDIRWMVVIHGMNSRAPWQETFSWEIANRLKYSAPVLIYKYGWATIEVLFAPVHRRMAKRLGERLRTAIEKARASALPDRPDVIAHSFGTRLFSLVLEDPTFADLRFGRVITAGSIIRPDFNWDRHYADDRVEAVLNHVAAQDTAVPLAQWCIPGSGPGGKVGYTSRKVLNVRNNQYGHSSFFEPTNIVDLIANDGLWHSFLTRPLGPFRPNGFFVKEDSWEAPSAWLGGGTRLIGFLVFLLILPFSWIRRLIDP